MIDIKYEDIKELLSNNRDFSEFDVYYLGFLSYYDKWRNQEEQFGYMKDHVSISKESSNFEAKVIALAENLCDHINPNICDIESTKVEEQKRTEVKQYVKEYLEQVERMVSTLKYTSKAELFFIGRFHAIYPSMVIDQLIQQIEKLNECTKGVEKPEKKKVEDLLVILGKKSPNTATGNRKLNIPKKNEINVKTEKNVVSPLRNTNIKERFIIILDEDDNIQNSRQTEESNEKDKSDDDKSESESSKSKEIEENIDEEGEEPSEEKNSEIAESDNNEKIPRVFLPSQDSNAIRPLQLTSISPQDIKIDVHLSPATESSSESDGEVSEEESDSAGPSNIDYIPFMQVPKDLKPPQDPSNGPSLSRQNDSFQHVCSPNSKRISQITASKDQGVASSIGRISARATEIINGVPRDINKLGTQIQLQAQDDEEDIGKQGNRNLTTGTRDTIRNQKSNVCVICRKEFSHHENRKKLEACEHFFHEECMQKYLNQNLKEKKVRIKCPYDDCDTEIRLIDMIDIADNSLLDNYITLCLTEYANNHDEVACCPTLGCSYIFLRDDNEKFKCPACRRDYCLSCKSDWHDDKTCQEFRKLRKNNTRTERVGNKFKECQKCGEWIARVHTFNTLKCKCGSEFCFVCGEERLENSCDCLRHKKPLPKVGQELFHKIMKTPDKILLLITPVKNIETNSESLQDSNRVKENTESAGEMNSLQKDEAFSYFEEDDNVSEKSGPPNSYKINKEDDESEQVKQKSPADDEGDDQEGKNNDDDDNDEGDNQEGENDNDDDEDDDDDDDDDDNDDSDEDNADEDNAYEYDDNNDVIAYD